MIYDKTCDKKVILGRYLSLEDFVSASRNAASITIAEECEKKMEESCTSLKEWIAGGRDVYGMTTGLGSLSNCKINEAEAVKMQKHILRSHAVSVGKPLSREQVRGTMILVVQNLSAGYSGVRKCLLDKYIELLNKDVIPWAPGSGSVGYLCPEAHIGLVIIGEGRAFYKGRLMAASEALKAAGIEPMELQPREALAMISGTTCATALGALALYDMIKAVKSADVIAALNVEVSKGQTDAFDEKVMAVRPHSKQQETAENLRKILRSSEYLRKARGTNLQDPLSLRCIPQLHGASKTLLENAEKVIETEMNSCCDNPIIFSNLRNEEAGSRVMSACNADSSFVGMSMDSACMAAACLAKISERRTYRLLDGSMPWLPKFLINGSAINSGLMITQYSQAGILNEMRMLSMPATVDSIPTSAGQEDYVAMGYNASKKAAESAEKLEYVLAIELLSVYQAGSMNKNMDEFSSCMKKVLSAVRTRIPMIKEDVYLHDYIEYLKDMIHAGTLVHEAEEAVGKLK